MANYDYQCQDCGPFSAVRPMAQSAEPCACPSCGGPAPRAFLTVPYIAGMEASQRQAFATNERARHEPKRGGSAHGPGCSCCSSTGKKGRSTLVRADGSKSFPAARPWMISH
ncbi:MULTISPECIES: FmdB family zinc ribbon protein [unclassified Devosia]|uniref:FmdB family zinc ribbon protein n=1 Tax=unclassified Devosia TaxID=196773 RepID=UPI00145F15DB|nr:MULTISPECIES: FmdB family zinc ribbon protein [unclassified Devosia]MBJ6986435.1 zinc ribbon domain-containing protein [Devosia sp. MC521]QMW64095.1 zinc ribbon domain-containing protein [Devosia sp. MC521]